MSDSALSGDLPTLPSSPQEPVPAPQSFDSLKGTQRFQTGELIGKGGMGQVFSCTDLKLKRSMAVKQATSRLPPEAGNATLLDNTAADPQMASSPPGACARTCSTECKSA